MNYSDPIYNYKELSASNSKFEKIQNFIQSKRFTELFPNSIPNVSKHWTLYEKTIELDRLKFAAARVCTHIFQKIQNVIKSQSANQFRQKLYWRKGHFGLTFIQNLYSIDWVIPEIQKFKFFEVLTHARTLKKKVYWVKKLGSCGVPLSYVVKWALYVI